MVLPEDVPLHSAGASSSGALSKRDFLAPLLIFAIAITTFVSDLRAQELSGSFAGRWDLTLKGTARDLPSWIEVSEDHGQLKVVLVGPTDHATPLKQAEIKNGELAFVSLKGEQGFDADTTYKAKIAGGRLVGTVTNAHHTWQLLGTRAPALSETKDPEKWGTPVHLFDGKSLAGWKAQRSQQEELGGRRWNTGQQRPWIGDHQHSEVL